MINIYGLIIVASFWLFFLAVIVAARGKFNFFKCGNSISYFIYIRGLQAISTVFCSVVCITTIPFWRFYAITKSIPSLEGYIFWLGLIQIVSLFVSFLTLYISDKTHTHKFFGLTFFVSLLVSEFTTSGGIFAMITIIGLLITFLLKRKLCVTGVGEFLVMFLASFWILALSI